MGNSQSTTLQALYSQLNEAITTEINQTISSNSAYCQTSNIQNVTIGSPAQCGIVTPPPSSYANLTPAQITAVMSAYQLPTIDCNLSLNQQAATICSLSSSFNSAQSTDISSILSNALNSVLSSDSSAMNDFLSTAFSYQQTSVSIQAQLSNIIQTTIQNLNINTCSVTATTNEQQNLLICSNVVCPNSGAITVNQSTTINATATCLTNALISTLISNTTTNSTIGQLESTSTSQNSGVGNILKNLLSSWEFLLVVGLILLIVIGYFIYKILLSPAGQQAIKQGSSAAVKAAVAYY